MTIQELHDQTREELASAEASSIFYQNKVKFLKSKLKKLEKGLEAEKKLLDSLEGDK